MLIRKSLSINWWTHREVLWICLLLSQKILETPNLSLEVRKLWGWDFSWHYRNRVLQRPSKIRVWRWCCVTKRILIRNSLNWRHRALIWWRLSALALLDNTRHTPEPHSPPKTVQMKSFLIVIKKFSSTKKKLRNVTKRKLTEMKLKSMVPARQRISIPPLIITVVRVVISNLKFPTAASLPTKLGRLATGDVGAARTFFPFR